MVSSTTGLVDIECGGETEGGNSTDDEGGARGLCNSAEHFEGKELDGFMERGGYPDPEGRCVGREVEA